MLLITCPHCGPRSELEFRWGGEAHVPRPTDPSALGDEAWAAFLFVRDNPRGVYAERWNHAHGCQRWFNALRNTATDAFVTTYPAGRPRPERGEIGR